jgi:predicted nucleic acid-binding protein
MELVIGCRNQAQLQRVREFLKVFPVVWPDIADSERSYELLLSHRLTSGLEIPDCLIAAMALNRNAPLYTFNLKHFAVINGLDVRQPYTRTTG